MANGNGHKPGGATTSTPTPEKGARSAEKRPPAYSGNLPDLRGGEPEAANAPQKSQFYDEAKRKH
jgi:hypothetical protein